MRTTWAPLADMEYSTLVAPHSDPDVPITWTPPRTMSAAAAEGIAAHRRGGDRASVGWTGSFERLGPSRDGLSGRRHLASRQPGGTAHVVNDVGEANLHRRPREPNGPNHETHRSLLMGEDVLNGGADL